MSKHAHNKLRDRAATALDRTHMVGERGPRTYNARQRLAAVLDANGTIKLSDIHWLENVSLTKPARS